MGSQASNHMRARRVYKALMSLRILMYVISRHEVCFRYTCYNLPGRLQTGVA